MQTLTEMAQAVGLSRKPFYTLTETAKATGISYSTLIRASNGGSLATFLPNGRERGRLTSAEWFAEWIAGGAA